MNDIHFSSETNEWSTPQDFFDHLDREFGFTLDVAATAKNAKCDRFFTLHDNGLSKDWTGEIVWMNPPYRRQIPRWIEKAKHEKAIVVCLVPARTDTKWWAKFWDYDRHRPIEGCEVRFLPKRLKFEGNPKDAPFPSAVVIFRNLTPTPATKGSETKV